MDTEERPMKSLGISLLDVNDARLIENLELVRQRAILWKETAITISFKEELLAKRGEFFLEIKADPPMKVIFLSRSAELLSAYLNVGVLTRWCKCHVRRVITKIKRKPHLFKKRTLLVGLMSVQNFPRHPNEKRKKLKRFLPVGLDV